MTRSRRPELEKDNPIAPQPRSRRPGRRSFQLETDEPVTEGQALEALTIAAERFIDGVPHLPNLDAERQALIDAISGAQVVLSTSRGHDIQPEEPSLAT
ncbi:MAG: hypothetical protein KF814_00555 [Nitrospiraceae bacterium]|nr:hypothetical protein [Nitrospiraceae bacterium]